MCGDVTVANNVPIVSWSPPVYIGGRLYVPPSATLIIDCTNRATDRLS